MQARLPHYRAEQVGSRLEAHVLLTCRLVFAAGVSAAFAVAAGPQASHLASSFISDTSSLWTAAARSTEAAVSNEACLGESIEAMESWSADTGLVLTGVMLQMERLYASLGCILRRCMPLFLEQYLLHCSISMASQEQLDMAVSPPIFRRQQMRYSTCITCDGFKLLIRTTTALQE